MDRTTFLEAILADYIARVSKLTKEELTQELIELKFYILESASDEEVFRQHYASRHIKD